MDKNDFLRQTLEHYRQQLQEKVNEIKVITATIRKLEADIGEAPSQLDFAQVSPDNTFTLFEAKTPDRKNMEIAPDQFFGMSQSEAAKAYLRKIGKAVSLDELVLALNNGGAQVGGADPKKTLYVALARNPLKEFVIPRDGFIGLREFYPSLPKPGPTKYKKPVKRRKVQRARQQSTAKDATNEKPKIQVAPIVRKALVGGQAHSVEHIMREVEEQAGRPVAKVAVMAVLRGKGFIEENGNYRLVQ